jgi:hypothetical protein
LEIVEEGDVFPVGEEGAECVALAVADLKGEEAIGLEGGAGLRDEATVEVEAEWTGEEGLRGLVVADLGMELSAVAFGNVGRVAEDGVVDFDFVVGDEVGVEEADAVGEVVGAGIFAGYGEGFGGDVEGGDAGMGEMCGEGQRNGSGAGADVEDLERLVVRDAVQDGFDEVLGLGSRDEGRGGDFEVEAEELLLAGDVLERLVAEAAVEERLVGGALLGREGTVGMSEEGGAVDLEEMEEQEFGVARGLLAEVRTCGEQGGGVGEGLAEVHEWKRRNGSGEVLGGFGFGL